jgi:hypothetical protein
VGISVLFEALFYKLDAVTTIVGKLVWLDSHHATNKYVPQTVIADAGTGKLNLTST